MDSSIGDVVDFVCLRNVNLRAKLVLAMPKKLPALSLGSLWFVIVPHRLEWGIVVKRGKCVPL